MLNRVVLTGRLTKDIELRYTQNGKAVGSFNLAVDRNFKDKDGNKQTDFINCVVWGKTAENMANFFHKGNLVGVDGQIQTRNYENKQGQRVYVTEVNISNFTFLESRNDQENSNYQNNDNYQNGQSNNGNYYNNDAYQPPSKNEPNYDNPAANNLYNGNGNQSNDDFTVDDDQLPF